MNTSTIDTSNAAAAASIRVFAAIELSKAKWVIAVHLPNRDKISLYQLDGGDLDGLFALLDRARTWADEDGGRAVEICTAYEAGYDGFWLHRAVTAKGIHNLVLDSASIQVSRRRRRVKTDRVDAESLLRVLMALYRGENRACSVVRAPTPEEEDHKRLLRSREALLRERIRHGNRIRGLLSLQSVRHIDPNRNDWDSALAALRTRDDRPFPIQLLREIQREGKLLATVKCLLAEADAEIAAMIRSAEPRRRQAVSGETHPIATRLACLRGVGPHIAASLMTDGPVSGPAPTGQPAGL